VEVSFVVASVAEVKEQQHSNSRLFWGGGRGTAVAEVLQEVIGHQQLTFQLA